MTKEKLIEAVKKILATGHDLTFLGKLTETELETLVASIRGRRSTLRLRKILRQSQGSAEREKPCYRRRYSPRVQKGGDVQVLTCAQVTFSRLQEGELMQTPLGLLTMGPSQTAGNSIYHFYERQNVELINKLENRI